MMPARTCSRATTLAVSFALLAFLLSGCTAAKRWRAHGELERGRRAMKAEDFPRARTYLLSALELDPDYSRAWYSYGLLALELQQPQVASEVFEQLCRERPEDHRAAHQLGIAYLRLSRFKDAERVLRLALRLDPDFAPSHYALGLIYERQGHDALARECFLRAYRALPDWPGLRERIERLDKSV